MWVLKLTSQASEVSVLSGLEPFISFQGAKQRISWVAGARWCVLHTLHLQKAACASSHLLPGSQHSTPPLPAGPRLACWWLPAPFTSSVLGSDGDHCAPSVLLAGPNRQVSGSV